MPAFVDLGFETMGGAAGMADGWHVRGKFSAAEILGFGPTPTVGPVADPNAFGGTGWTQTGITITADSTTDPDGATTADTLLEQGVAGIHADELPAEDLAQGARYGLSCFFKIGTRTFSALAWGLGTADESAAIFDLTNGRVASTSRGGSISKASASIFALGSSGWFLATLYVTTSAAITGIKPAVTLSDGTALSYAGTGGLDVYAWGAAVFDLPRESFDAFERAWSNDDFLATLTIPDSAYPSTFLTAFVDPEGFEAFESAWSNFPFYSTISIGASASFDTVPQSVEDFEIEWGATPFYTTIPGAVAATFAGDSFENFDWLSLITTFAGTLATFDGDVPENVEDFEEVIRDKSFEVDTIANNLVSAGHGLLNDQTVYVLRPYGGDIPSAFNPTIRYFVVNRTANTFQLAETSGGTPPTLGDEGIGDQAVRGDPSRYWNETGYNPTL